MYHSGKFIKIFFILLSQLFWTESFKSCAKFKHFNLRYLKPINEELTPLFSGGYGDRENKGISLKLIGTFAILSFGVFGTGFLGTINNAVRDITAPASVKSSVQFKSAEESRGSLTHLSRKEINTKLQNVPVFYATADKGKSIYTVNNQGFLFVTKEDAKDYIKILNDKDVKLDVMATSLDDVFYPLIEKKSKIAKFVNGPSAASDPYSSFKLKTSQQSYADASDSYKLKHTVDDIPLYRVTKLVFSKDSGLEIPLFLSKNDALTTYARLRETKKTEPTRSTATDEDANIQETSLLDIIRLFEQGGFEGRAVEFYPTMQAITDARSLMGVTGPSES